MFGHVIKLCEINFSAPSHIDINDTFLLRFPVTDAY